MSRGWARFGSARRGRGIAPERRSYGVFAALVALLLGAAAQAADAPRISLLTFAPGEVYWQRFGHNALLVRDTTRGEARVYNYGIFDFHQDNFFLNFARGKMLYRLDEAPLNWTLRQYAAEGRWAVEQELALSELQRRGLADFLAWNALPENADYRYDYFTANCSTRVRDAVDAALGGQLRAQLAAQPGAASYRSEVLRLMAPMPALMLGMDLGLGPQADVRLDRWREGFVPMRLMEAVRTVRIEDETGGLRPLVDAERRLLPARLPEPPTQAPSLLWPLLLSGLGFAVVLALSSLARTPAPLRAAGTALRWTYAVVCGLAGLVLLLGWVATEHWGMAANRNLMLLNPLWLALPFVRGRARTALIALLGACAVIGSAVALFDVQPNLHWAALLLPVHAVVLVRFLSPSPARSRGRGPG